MTGCENGKFTVHEGLVQRCWTVSTHIKQISKDFIVWFVHRSVLPDWSASENSCNGICSNGLQLYHSISVFHWYILASASPRKQPWKIMMNNYEMLSKITADHKDTKGVYSIADHTDNKWVSTTTDHTDTKGVYSTADTNLLMSKGSASIKYKTHTPGIYYFFLNSSP